MLDRDLAELYGVETKRLKEQVNRNLERFPPHFMFELTLGVVRKALRSQNATLKQGAHSKYLPYAFAEHGVLMLSNVLKSGRAIEMSIKIIGCVCKAPGKSVYPQRHFAKAGTTGTTGHTEQHGHTDDIYGPQRTASPTTETARPGWLPEE